MGGGIGKVGRQSPGVSANQGTSAATQTKPAQTTVTAQEAKGGPAVSTDQYGKAKGTGAGQPSSTTQAPDTLKRSPRGESAQVNLPEDTIKASAKPRVDPMKVQVAVRDFNNIMNDPSKSPKQRAEAAAEFLRKLPPDVLAETVKKLQKQDPNAPLNRCVRALDDDAHTRLFTNVKKKLEMVGDKAAVRAWEYTDAARELAKNR
jgi:hypothetical protein